MSHREIIRRAIGERLEEYEGNKYAGQMTFERERFIDDVTELIVQMLVNGSTEHRKELIHA